MSRLKMAVVGVGALGKHHTRILSSFENVELVGVVDTNSEIGQDIAKTYDVPWFADISDVFDSAQAVCIAVPTTGHLKVATEFLKRKIPVLIEKPIALDVPQSEELIALADEQQTIVQVGHVERFNPATQSAFALCGSPKYIRAERLSPYAYRSIDVSVVHDLMIHDIDLVLSLTQSSVRSVSALGMCVMGGFADIVQAHLVLENGCVVDLTANRVNPTPQRTMQVMSATGSVSVDFTSREVQHIRPTETLLYGTSPWERARQPDADILKLKEDVFTRFLKVDSPRVPDNDALTAELESFVDCVLENRKPVVDGIQATAAMKVAEQILESVESHQWDGHAAGPVGPHAQSQQPLRKAA